MNLVMLRTEIDRRGLKHRALAEQIEMHPTTFCRALKGQAKFTVNQMAKLLKILNLKFEALVKSAS